MRPVCGIRAVLCDMDGLLLDSERVALSLLAEAARALGLAWRAEVGLGMVGLRARDADALVRRHLGEEFPIAALRQAFSLRYKAAIEAGAIPAKPGAAELLDLLEAAGLPRAVATSTRRALAEPKLAAVGLLGRFQGMVCGDEVQRGKPAPDIFLAAAVALDAEPGHCLVLEDSNAGIRGALAAGMQPVMVPDVLEPAEDIIAAGVPLAADLLEVVQALRAGLAGQGRS